MSSLVFMIMFVSSDCTWVEYLPPKDMQCVDMTYRMMRDKLGVSTVFLVEIYDPERLVLHELQS